MYITSATCPMSLNDFPLLLLQQPLHTLDRIFDEALARVHVWYDRPEAYVIESVEEQYVSLSMMMVYHVEIPVISSAEVH